MKQKPIQKSTNKSSVKPSPVIKEVKRVSTKPFFLDPYMEKYGLLITLGMVSLLILIIFHKFIAGNAYYLFKDIGSDSINQAYPHFVLLSKYLRSEGFPLWSFAQGMGQELMSGSVNDPFSFCLSLLPPDQIAYGVIWIEIAKIFLTSIVFYRLLRIWNLQPMISLAGTLLYSFSGFLIVGGGWTIFSTEAFYFALMLLAFEKLYRQNSWYLFPVSIALIAILRPFDLYIFGLFLILYFLFRHLSSEKPTFRKLLIVSGQMLALSILGILISMFLFVPGVQIMLDSPRVGGTAGYFSKLMSKPLFFVEDNIFFQTMVARLFSNDLMGNGTAFKGWYNYLEAPLIYIGILPLLLAPQIFLTLSNRNKIVYAALFLVFLLAAIFPFFRYAFWFFAGEYFRAFSIFIAIVILFYSLEALNALKGKQNINLILLGITLVFLLFLLYFPWKNVLLIDSDQRSAVRNFLFIYALVLGLSRFYTNPRLLQILLVAVIFIEIGYFNYVNVNSRVVLTKTESKQKTGYNDYTVEAISFLNNRDRQFYRVNKDFTSNPAVHMSFSDAQIQGFFGTMSYNSFNQKYYIRFLEGMNLIEKGNETQSRWAIGLIQSPLLLNWASTKYNLRIHKGSEMGLPEDSIARFGNIKVCQSKLFLPLGFTYEKYIPIAVFAKLSKMQKMIVLYQAAVVEEPLDPLIKAGLTEFNVRDTISNYTSVEYSRDVTALKQDTLNMTSFSENKIEGTITVNRDKLLFFSIPNDRGWNAVVDQQEVKPLLTNIGFMGLMMKPGTHKVTLYYKPPYFNISLMVSLVSLLIFAALVGLSIYKKRKSKLTQAITGDPVDQTSS
jgi:uncharacterized membrane protein YfhO